MSYGADFAALFQQSAEYVVKILAGAAPAELAVQRPTQFQLVINQRVAEHLKIEIPLALLAGADQVLE
jgi:putative ABC transport system substrate-binding protein